MRDLTDLPGAEHARIDVGEVTLHAVSMGSGPPVVLLHGFPELWWSWRHQLPALAAAGRRAIAPDLRGYAGSDRPRGVEAYALPRLAGDVAGLVRALGGGPAVIVGHDWGGALAWAVAARYPELVDRLVVLNAPHPAAMLRALRRPRQLLRSSYMLLFQLPVVPERLLAAFDHALLRRALRASRSGPVPDAELEPYVAAAREAGLGGGLDWYRAMGRALLRGRSGAGAPRRRVEAPVFVVWGERDPFLGPELATPPPDRVRDARVLRIADAGHWVQLDAPERVNAAILGFLAEPVGAAR